MDQYVLMNRHNMFPETADSPALSVRSTVEKRMPAELLRSRFEVVKTCLSSLQRRNGKFPLLPAFSGKDCPWEQFTEKEYYSRILLNQYSQ